MTNRPQLLTLLMALALALAISAPCFADDSLQWDVGRDRVTATVEKWTVPELLQRVAGHTGWQIFIDPEIKERIPARFADKQPGDALRQLLGRYNYALVPETNGPAKLFVFRDSRDQATRALQPIIVVKGSKSRIANELIVTLKPGEKIEDIAKKLGAKIIGRADGQNTYRLRFDNEKATETARTSLESDPAVDSVDNNYYVSRPETIQALGTPGGPLGLTPKASPDGKYTVVGLVDSAVQPKEGDFSDFIVPGSDTEASADCQPSHGTSMAETILRSLAARSPDKSTSVRLLPVNVFSEGAAQTTTYDIAKGIYKAVNGGAMIVNLSLGGEGDSSFMHNTIKSAHDQGVVFFAAAGNEPVSTATYPAAYPEVIAVTASDRSGTQLASYANRGSFVDVVAPGGNVINFQCGGTSPQQYYVAGTSTSTAFVSGFAGAMAEKNGTTGTTLEASVLQALSPKASAPSPAPAPK